MQKKDSETFFQALYSRATLFSIFKEKKYNIMVV